VFFLFFLQCTLENIYFCALSPITYLPIYLVGGATPFFY